jgi:hypothetical protein
MKPQTIGSLRLLLPRLLLVISLLGSATGCEDAAGVTALPDPQVSIRVDDTYRYVDSNGIPDHETGEFPNAANPNRISAQSNAFRMLLEPLETDFAHRSPVFGVATNGVPFEPGTAEFWNRDPSAGWNYEALTGHLYLGTDWSHAHVQPTGKYHYHGVPEGIVSNLIGGNVELVLVGWASDGFPIYARFGYADALDASSEIVEMESSWDLRSGTRPSGPGGAYDGTFTADFEYVEGLGDLDECNGRFGVTPEYPDGTYHYYLTDDFPFIPRCVVAEPDPSFAHGTPGGPPPS